MVPRHVSRPSEIHEGLIDSLRHGSGNSGQDAVTGQDFFVIFWSSATDLVAPSCDAFVGLRAGEWVSRQGTVEERATKTGSRSSGMEMFAKYGVEAARVLYNNIFPTAEVLTYIQPTFRLIQSQQCQN